MWSPDRNPAPEPLRGRRPRRGSRRAGRGAPRAPRGFTLLEILVALAVLSIALVTLYQSFASTVQINTATGGLWKAMIYVNNELARIERGRTPSVSLEQGTFEPDEPMAGYTWLRQVVDEEPFPGVRVRKVVLELTWEIAGVPQSYQSQIYVQPN
jgi:general secretion pathway protein I